MPDVLFTDLIPQIDDLAELKVTLLILWRLAQMRSDAAPWITQTELLHDPKVQAALRTTRYCDPNDPDPNIEDVLEEALARTVDRGALLMTRWERGDGVIERRYFANSPRGRAAVAAIDRGQIPTRATLPERPNIFTLYEQNIGPLTPLMADELRDAEQTYEEAWIAEAFREAVRQNKRNWKYILAILERWRTEGQHGAYRQDRKEDRRRYIEGEYADIIRH
jgi:DnaD/phage-associated family protein